jgi:dTDP-4-dehydrorhamnose reductase
VIDKTSRYLILGKNGMLGSDLQRVFHDCDFIALGQDELDITDEEAVKAKIMDIQPDVVINATAYKDVQKAESEEETANQVNGYGVGKLAAICRDFGIVFVHFSTDYVFDGSLKDGYKEDDPTGPLNAYGRSKLLGEQLLMDAMEAEYPDDDDKSQGGKYFIIRTSYLFGHHGQNLMSKMLDKASKRSKFQAVNDQWSRPTYSLDLSRQVRWLLESNEYEPGIFHITNDGYTNWYEMAKELVEQAGFVSDVVEPCSVNDWPSVAKRPQYSVLLNTKLPQMRHWKEALKEYLEEKKTI